MNMHQQGGVANGSVKLNAGIDVNKLHLDVCVRDTQQRVANASTGHDIRAFSAAMAATAFQWPRRSSSAIAQRRTESVLFFAAASTAQRESLPMKISNFHDRIDAADRCEKWVIAQSR